MLENAALGLVVLEVKEANLSLSGHGALYGVDVVEHRLVLRLDPALDVHPAPKVVREVPARKLPKRFHQRGALALREEFRRLDRIREKKELSVLEVPGGQPPLGLAALVLLDVVAELAQAVDVAVERLALDVDAAFDKLGYELGAREPVLVVSLALEYLGEMKELQLLCGGGHPRPPGVEGIPLDPYDNPSTGTNCPSDAP